MKEASFADSQVESLIELTTLERVCNSPVVIESVEESTELLDLEVSTSYSDDYQSSLSRKSSTSSSSDDSSDSDSSGSQKCPEKVNETKDIVKKIIIEQNIRKAKRLRGQIMYIGHRGIEKPTRPILPFSCCRKLKHKCCELVDEGDRFQIYTVFRNIPSVDE